MDRFWALASGAILLLCIINACKDEDVCSTSIEISGAKNNCGGETIKLSALHAGDDSLQWQQSFDNVNWSDIPGAHDTVIMVAPTQTVYYRIAVIAGACNTSTDAHLVSPNITDADGNVYTTVEIGNQCWMATNLRATGGIDELADSAQWRAIIETPTQTPAWCYYDNDSANDPFYGKLYNWYAVSSGTLCPAGWHLPSEAEWQQLITSLGGAAAAGGKLKSTAGWSGPNTGATNSSGFGALPSGTRVGSAEFTAIGENTAFWSATTNGAAHAFAFGLAHNTAAVSNNMNGNKANGNACRCIRNE